MHILVIGGTNFMGPLVVRLLSEQGHEIAVFHRGNTQADFPHGVKEILGDRRTLDLKAVELQRLAPEVVLDMIPFTEQDALEVMRTFSGTALRLVAISSQDVYRAFGRVNDKESGPVESIPITEESPLRQNLYPYRGETLRNQNDPKRWQDDYEKILVERVVMGDKNLPGTILRLPMVYGPGDYQHRLPHGRLPESLRWDINAEQDIVVDSSRIRSELGYHERVDVEEALRSTIAWERENPPKELDPKDFDYVMEDSFLNASKE